MNDDKRSASLSGAGKLSGGDYNANVKELKCSGSYRVKDSITAEYVKISGVLKVGADVEADIFKASGGFEIEGLLSADKIEIRPGGRCYAKEIGGEKIDVRRGGYRERGILLDGLVRMFTGKGTAELRANVIEGDEVHLEDTVADIVRGKTVEIGPGCQIGTVEYSEKLDVHPNAEVKNRKQV